MATNLLRLYDHVDDYVTVLDWILEHEDEIREAGGVIPPELDELLDLVEGDLEEKVKRTALVVQNLKANAKAAKEEADRLATTARGFTRQADALTNYLHVQLNRAGVERIETPVAKVRIQRASRPSIRPVGEIPEEFQQVSITFDGAKAYDHLKPLLGKDCEDVGEIDGLRFEYSYSPRIW